MVSMEAVQATAALEPEDGWPGPGVETAVETTAHEMIEAGMHPTRVEELLGELMCSMMGEMG